MFTVLLVEDNEGDEALALRALKKVGVPIKVDVARDGLEAVNYLSNLELPCPDLVLLDLKLPKINGIEVLRHIRGNKRTKRLPVVVMTSSNEQSDVVASFDCGANSFVHKPIEFEKYLANVTKLADYWLTLNEPCEYHSLGGNIQGPR